jgi:hypothetical protein
MSSGARLIAPSQAMIASTASLILRDPSGIRVISLALGSDPRSWGCGRAGEPRRRTTARKCSKVAGPTHPLDRFQMEQSA